MSRTQENIFEFAIAQQRRRPLSRRFYAAVGVSLLCHFLAVVILIEYPQLLGSGLRTWLRLPVFSTKTVTREPAWRMAALLGKGGMEMPPADVLKKNTYDWNAHREGTPAPTIRLKWGGELADRKEDKPTPVVKPAQATEEPKPPEVASTAPKQGEQPANPPGTPGGDVAGKGVVVPLPPPVAEPRQIPKKAADTAAMVTPGGTPGPDKPGSTPVTAAKPGAQGKPPAQVFENEQKAIQSEGTGFFGVPKGYPIGEYAELIIERIKGNWFIPSNLRRSQGRTTVVFFIEKDGRYSNAHIVTPSGSSSLDLAALNAIIGSDPFPPLPKGFPGDRVGAKFVFAYNEHQ